MVNAGKQSNVNLNARSLHERRHPGRLIAVNHEIRHYRAKMSPIETKRSYIHRAAGTFLGRHDDLMPDVIPEPVRLDDYDRCDDTHENQRAQTDRNIPDQF